MAERHDDVAVIDYNEEAIVAKLKGLSQLSKVDQ